MEFANVSGKLDYLLGRLTIYHNINDFERLSDTQPPPIVGCYKKLNDEYTNLDNINRAQKVCHIFHFHILRD